MSEEREVRYIQVQELRAAEPEGDQPAKITGYAAVFNSLSEDLGGFQERIRPGAFRKTLEEHDQRALWNHDTNHVLGRRKAGTLELVEDEIGLQFTIYPPDTQAGRDALESMRRGDVDQMSFGFRTIRDNWEQVDTKILRELIEVQLYEVSPVTFPAYPQTSAFVRSKVNEYTAAPVQVDHPAVEDEARAARARKYAAMKRLVELLLRS